MWILGGIICPQLLFVMVNTIDPLINIVDGPDFPGRNSFRDRGARKVFNTWGINYYFVP